MTTPTYTCIYSYLEVEYEPKGYLSALDHFHLAECARKRMSENVCDIKRWRGERRSFYSAVSMMHADEVRHQD
jgi:hypothetical protein